MNLLQAGLLLAGICWLEGPGAPPKAAEKPRVAEWIQELIAQLGAHEFRTREQAAAALEQQGEAVLPALRQALTESGDPEIRVRAEWLIAAIEERNRARHALQQILARAQQSKEPPSEQQLVHALYLLTLGRPATPEERQQGEKQLKAARLRETALADLIDELRQHPDYSKALSEARLQVLEFHKELARDRAGAMNALFYSKGNKLPIHAAAKSIAEVAKPLDDRTTIDLLFLMTVARLPAVKEYAQVEKHLKPPKPADRQGLVADLWWALLNSNEFLLAGQPPP